MKTILCVALTLSGLILAADNHTELDQVLCLHYENINDEAAFSVSFKSLENDFVRLTASERFVSKYTHDTKWVEVYSSDEQVATSATAYNLGIDDISMQIQRPIPELNTATRDNARLDLGNGVKVNLRCEKLK